MLIQYGFGCQSWYFDVSQDATKQCTDDQRCSTRVQDLDWSPVFLDLHLRPVDSDFDLTHPDLK
jgi:hypothetical protein